jgi:hypothetical protein
MARAVHASILIEIMEIGMAGLKLFADSACTTGPSGVTFAFASVGVDTCECRFSRSRRSDEQERTVVVGLHPLPNELNSLGLTDYLIEAPRAVFPVKTYGHWWDSACAFVPGFSGFAITNVALLSDNRAVQRGLRPAAGREHRVVKVDSKLTRHTSPHFGTFDLAELLADIDFGEFHWRFSIGVSRYLAFWAQPSSLTLRRPP